MRYPNFFIVGAPKCGTTALFNYLGDHPQVYVPPRNRKEPNYFSTDLKLPSNLSVRGDYESLFTAAGEHHLAVGEASTRYLFSSVAIAKIFAFNPQARILAMVRNPVEAVHAYHAELCYGREEIVTRIRSGLESAGNAGSGSVPAADCPEPRILQYREVFQLGHQVERLLQVFPPEQVKIIVFDDFARSTKEVYEEVLEFLQLPPDDRMEFPPINAHRQDRWRALHSLVMRPPPMLVSAANRLKRLLGRESLGVGFALQRLNSREFHRAPLSPDFRRQLCQAFGDDVYKLSGLLDRDLSGWLADSPATGTHDV